MPSKLINELTITEYQALVSGIPKYCPNAIFTVAGQTFTAPEAVTFIESVLNAVSAIATAKTAWADAKLAAEKTLSQNGAAVKAIRENIALMFSNNTTTLAVFEIAPKKVRQPLSVAARAEATAKAKATRLARGTTSKKQKAALSGDVVGVTITPVTRAAATPAATSSSAAAPAATGGTAGATASSSTAAPTAASPSIAPLPATPAAANGAAAAPATSATTHP